MSNRAVTCFIVLAFVLGWFGCRYQNDLWWYLFPAVTVESDPVSIEQKEQAGEKECEKVRKILDAGAQVNLCTIGISDYAGGKIIRKWRWSKLGHNETWGWVTK